jgi:hypothetical protein
MMAYQPGSGARGEAGLVRRWRDADQRAELAAERPQAGVADQHAHLGDGEVRGSHQILGPFDASFSKVRRWCRAVCEGEAAKEVELGDPSGIRQLVGVERLGIVPVDEVLRPTQVHQEMFRCANYQAILTRR